MIEIAGGSIKINDVSKLVHGNPIDGVFESLNDIWSHAWFKDDEYYPLGEELASKFEEQVFNLYPEIYDCILTNAERSDKISEVLSKPRYCLVVMDGMSLREVLPLLKEFKKYGEVKYRYAYSAIPSETEFFTRRHFNTASPSQIKSSERYHFVHLQREDDIEDIPSDKDKLIAWSTYPDSIFSQFKSGFETQDLKEVFNKTKDILLRLLEHLSSSKEIIITSDHGYFVDTFSWKGLDDFPSGERYSFNIPESLKRYCRQFDDYWILVGRYNTIKRGKYTHVRHGGLSFLETIIPFIEVKREGGE
ncbi:MAG: hypothetical protein SCAL_000577 [Candidatus Syntrophoarchaeum caldarius]|uniref:PglZ domain-containing protein n=1 Tax=Candidatus Syntropharchaeum caldarium TaxID=1838285 RepID=A0A1F2P9B2_9EURY|nr:MAG: hypothetical protein SCAL_000577 [Candidatus Syntrophoarchaeum caldarius]